MPSTPSLATWWIIRTESIPPPGLAIARCLKAAPGQHAHAWRTIPIATFFRQPARMSLPVFAPVPGRQEVLGNRGGTGVLLSHVPSLRELLQALPKPVYGLLFGQPDIIP